MGDIDIYLAGEEHNNHQYRMAEIELIKDMAESNTINCLSLELPFQRYNQHLKGFSLEELETHSPFGELTPIIFIAKKKGLDVIASDYRDTLAGYIIEGLRKADDSFHCSDDNKEKELEKLLLPLKYAPGDSSFYNGFSGDVAAAPDIFDFISAAYDEERERFTASILDNYIGTNAGAVVLHIAGHDHVEGIKRKLEDKGRRTDLVKLCLVDGVL